MWLLVVSICLVACSTLALSGQLHPDIVPDTASYFRVGALPSALAQPRTPAYMWLVGPLYFNGLLAFIPWLHLAAFVTATVLLVRECKRSGLSRVGVVSMSLALLTSTALFKITNEIVPESLALSFGLVAIAATLWSARSPKSTYPLIAVLLAAGVCYLLRPIYLPLMLALPALHYSFSRIEIKRVATLAVLFAVVLPFLVYSGVRYYFDRDFNVVSFGGYQASAIASFMLTPDLVRRMPKSARDDASELLEHRLDAEQNDGIIKVPKRTDGTRSFGSTAIAFPDSFAVGYDPVLNRIITMRAKDEPWVAFNARLMKTDLAVFKASPVSYAEWVVGATARFVGHAIVINPSMLIAIVLFVFSLLLPSSGKAGEIQSDMKLMTAIALAWVFAGGLLAVTASFPAQRYIDSASVLLSAIPFYSFVRSVEDFFARRFLPQSPRA